MLHLSVERVPHSGAVRHGRANCNVLAFDAAKPCQRARIRRSETLPTCSHSMQRNLANVLAFDSSNPTPHTFHQSLLLSPSQNDGTYSPMRNSRERHDTRYQDSLSLPPPSLALKTHLGDTHTANARCGNSTGCQRGSNSALYWRGIWCHSDVAAQE